MRLWVLSDLHIDSFSQWDDPLDLSPHPECDFIVMAGDLCDGTYDPIQWLMANFSDEERGKLIFVPGNHEAYGIGLANIRDRLRDMREQTGITTLYRQTVTLHEKRFVGCTLWSPLDPRLDDRGGDLTAIPSFDGDKWRARHRDDRMWLDETVLPGDIVITHHAPHQDGLATAMQHSLRLMAVSSGYYSDMSNLMAERVPAVWIHGHTHCTREYEVEGTKVVTNGRGRGHAPLFVPNLVIEILEPVPAPKWP